MFENYAKLLIQVGLHVKRNQIVVIQAPVEVYSFVEALSQEAFRAGAKDVIVRYRDEIISHHRYLYADDVEKVPSYVSDLYNQTAKKGACYLYLVGDDPNLMKDVDPKKFTNYRKAFRKDTAFYRHQLDFMHCQWCVAAVATRSWSKQIYGHEDTHRLWQDILRICHVDEKDPVDTWEKRKQQFEKRVDWINSLELRSLHYRNHLGTDLMVELPEHYRFAGGNSLLIDGTSYFANIPTEEIFAAPLKKGIQGKLVASMPLSHQGTLIKDFWFQFKDGKVIDFDAKEVKGKDSFVLSNLHKHQLEHLIKVLEHGGISFIIVRFYINNKTYLLPTDKIVYFIKNYERKSIPLSYFLENGYEIKDKYTPRVDYLEVLDKLYF